MEKRVPAKRGRGRPPIYKRSDVMFRIRLPKPVADWYQRQAAENGRSLTAEVRFALVGLAGRRRS